LPRKPNYKFERFERDRAKAIKKAARQQAKVDRRTPKPGEDGAIEGDADAAAELSEDIVKASPGTD